VGIAIALDRHWHYLDSGALYRGVALFAERVGLGVESDVGSGETLISRLGRIDLRTELMPDGRLVVRLNGEDVSDAIRTESCGYGASRLAVDMAMRRALIPVQHRARRAPGLVADGRDMGTVVFPDAVLKVFLIADPEVRAKRRYKQLKEKGFDVTLPKLRAAIEGRDRRDAGRDVSPLIPAAEARVVDTSALTVDEVTACIHHLLDDSLRLRAGAKHRSGA
jgi:cytidylate kinase